MTTASHANLGARALSRRLIFWTVVFSGALALVITAVQLVIEYRRDVDTVEQRFDLVQQGYLASIVDNVWVADREHLATLLDGIVHLPDFAYARVNVDGKPYVERGVPPTTDGITRTWTLQREYRDRQLVIGELTIKADLATARQRFIDRAVFIVAANVFKTILVAVFMLLLVKRLVTRHLEKIADYLANSSPARLGTPLELDRPPREDELDRLVHALNRLRTDLFAHHTRLRESEARLERRVAERTAELERANKELETFSYSVSHDLQAPLRAIIGYSNILVEDERDRLSEPGRDILDRVIRNTRHMSTLIDNVLEYSRAGRRVLEKQDVDFTALAREVANRLGANYPAARIVVDAMPAAFGDPTMLEQVLQNLIGNALKYSSKKEQPQIEIGCEPGDGRTVYFVKDNGAGFDMNYATKLFGMFQRMHPESQFPGTGVGLAIVKRLVERHGGEVWATAEPEQGAQFYFTLGDKT